MTKEGHHEFTNAFNCVNDAIRKLKTASEISPDYEPLLDYAHSLRDSMYDMWYQGVVKGREEGWFK